MICSMRSAGVCTCSESWPMAALLTSASTTPSLRLDLLDEGLAGLGVGDVDRAEVRRSRGTARPAPRARGSRCGRTRRRLTPCSSRSVTMARPRPREAPEISTTVAAGTGSSSSAVGVASSCVVSDIALQRLLRRNRVQQLDPARYAVVGQPLLAPAVDRGQRCPGPRSRRSGAPPRRRPSCRPAAPCGRARGPRPRPGATAAPTVTTPAETFAPPTLISSALVRPVISTRPSSTTTASPVRTAPSRPSPWWGEAITSSPSTDGDPRPVGDVAVQPLDREPGPAVVDHDRGADLGGGVDPGDPGLREDLGQLVEHRLVDRLAAEADLLQRAPWPGRRRGS